MPDVSIAVSLQDKYSTKIKTMAQQSEYFSKDLDELSDTIEKLERNQESYAREVSDTTVALEKARSAVKDARTAYRQLGDETSATNLRNAQNEFETLTARIKTLRTESTNTQKSISSLATQASKMTTGGGGTGGGIGAASSIASVGSALVSAGVIQMVGDAASQVAGTFVGSAFGQTAGTVFESALGGIASGAAAGAALGSIIPGLGTAVGAGAGAVLGGVTGAISGGSQAYEIEDQYFKDYVQTSVEGAQEGLASDIEAGRAIAAQREMDLISFDTLLAGGEAEAQAFLDDVKTMANTTPFLYGDLTSLSKTLLAYGTAEERIMDVITDVGDTGAALGLGTDDINMLGVALGRMESTDKASLEYINLLTERGVGVVDWLAERDQISVGTVYENISDGLYSGKETAAYISEMMGDTYGGSMERQSQTLSGLESTVEGMRQELQAAAGAGFSDTRKEGLGAEIEYLSGLSGQQMEEAYYALGAFEAEQLNAQEEFVRTAVEDTMYSWEYQQAAAKDDAATMGALIMEAQIQGMNEYNASDGAQLLLESELSLIASVRDNSAANEEYYNAGYLRGEEYSRGLAAGAGDNILSALTPSGSTPPSTEGASVWQSHRRAFGMTSVPYDDYPALLHEGERVLTAQQARQADSATSAPAISISIGNMSVREEADIQRIAEELQALMAQQTMAGRF